MPTGGGGRSERRLFRGPSATQAARLSSPILYAVPGTLRAPETPSRPPGDGPQGTAPRPEPFGAPCDSIQLWPLRCEATLAMLVGELLDLHTALWARSEPPVGRVARRDGVTAAKHVVFLGTLSLVQLHDPTPHIRDRELALPGLRSARHLVACS